ncbi:hypothetical protein [Legionella hackeliae]|nr:hypothetical protein [Legionella hackeliae]KTD12586.1 coiled-coil protein [Legionella hackeliae]STX48784.1 coiled-coil protein [Legionella hackeliae]
MAIISLSTKSQDLISKLSQNPDYAALFTSQQTTIERQQILQWIEKTHAIASSDKYASQVASLNASLLRDLHDSLNPPSKKKDKSANWYNRAKYAFLAIAGTIYFGCEGFDGVTAVLAVFSSVPTMVIFAAGAFFSVLSIFVFYSFDLAAISKNLGVKKKDTSQLLDALFTESKQIQAMREELRNSVVTTQEELEENKALAIVLLKRYQALEETRKQLKLALDNPYLIAAKKGTAFVVGLIFLSGGYFAGQTVAMALAGLALASVTHGLGVIIAASCVVALAAFLVYWYVERPGIENLIGRWRGLDQEKIDVLCDPETVKKETRALQSLVDGLELQQQLLQSNTELTAQKTTLSHQLDDLMQLNGLLTIRASEFESQVDALKKQLKSLQLELDRAHNSLIGVQDASKAKNTHNERIDSIVVSLPNATKNGDANTGVNMNTFFGKPQSEEKEGTCIHASELGVEGKEQKVANF